MVLVSHPHEFVFLKTRKTAGTSVEMLLEPLCAPAGHTVTEKTPCVISRAGVIGSRLIPKGRFDDFDPLRRKWRNHMPAEKVERYLGKSRWSRYRKIATVRDPFDRTVSYFHFRYYRDPIMERDFAEIRRKFHDFVKNEDWPDDTEVVTAHGDFVIDHAIRYEHMREDLLEVADTLGIELDLEELPVTKSTAKVRKSYAVPDYYDDRSVEVVRDRLSWLFERFDYPSEPGAARRAAGD